MPLPLPPKSQWVLVALGVLVLALIWYDGGREPQRLIEQPVDLPEDKMPDGKQ